MNVIDELVVILGLDAKNFTEGQRAALAAFKKTQEEATRVGKSVEAQGKKINEFFTGLKREAISLFAAFYAGRSIKEFISYVTTLDAQTGRLAKTLNLTTEELSAWQGIATITGGSAEAMTGSLQGLNNQIQRFHLGFGGGENFLPQLSQLGISLYDSNNQLKTMTQLFLEIAKAVEGMNPARAATILSSLGIDQVTLNTLLLGKNRLVELREEMRRLGETTGQNSENARKLQEEWGKASLAATSLGRTLLNVLSPALTWILDKFKKVFTEIRTGETLKRNMKLLEESEGRASGTNLLREAFANRQNSGSLRVKSGSGSTSPATSGLARALQDSIPGINRFTSFNDPYHALLGRGSGHSTGRALDFTVNNPSESAVIAAAVRKKLLEMGIDGKVIDEYTNPSRGSTGGHIHVQFNSDAAARKYGAGIGAPAAAAASVNNSRSSSSSSTNSTTIGTIIVNSGATDAAGIARDIKPAIERNSFAASANYGQQ